MKNLLIILAVLTAESVLAQEIILEEKKLASEVKEVTVYFKGAQVKREKSLKLKAGKYRLIFEGLEPDLIDNSLQVDVSDGLVINYVNKRSNFLKRVEKNHEAELVQSKIDSLQLLVEDESDILALYQNQEKILALNNEIGGQEQGVKISELIQTVQFYEVKLKEVKLAQRQSHRKIKTLKKSLQELLAQKQEITSIVPPKTSEIVVEASCEQNFKGNVSLKYIIPNAGWTPIYDLRAEDVDEPISLALKANVRQSSGSDWKNVQLNLTSENPFESGQMPQLKRWDLGQLRKQEPDPVISPPPLTGTGTGTIQGTVSDEQTTESVPFANVVLMREGQQVTGASTDFDGNFKLKNINAGIYNLKTSAVGFTPLEKRGVVVNGAKTSTVNFKMSAGVKLDEVCVISYKVPLIDSDGSSGGTFSGGKFLGANSTGGSNLIGSVKGVSIEKMPSRGAAAAVTTVVGVQNSQNYIRGTRHEATNAYIDGVKVRGSSSIPQASFAPRGVIQGGVPASYDDMDGLVASSSNQPYYNSHFSSGFSKRNKRIAVNTSIRKKETRVFYKVETPFTVLSDDKDYTVQIDELEINAQMGYFAAPIEVPHAFLIAKITDWERFNLLEGTISLYVSGTYIGQSLLSPENTGDTLLVSLGSDKSVVVEREELKDFTKQQIIGNKTIDHRGYSIKLKNNKEKLVHLQLQDQLPVSTSRDVTVLLLEGAEGKLDEDKGILEWKLDLLPDESRTITFKYMVKRPSWRKINLE